MKRPLSWHFWRRDTYGPCTFWVRIGYCGWGLHVRYRMRVDDYRSFSERMGLTRTRRVGPLTITVLPPYGTGR